MLKPDKKILCLVLLLSLAGQRETALGDSAIRVAGGASRATKNATRLGRLAREQSLHLALSLQPKDPAGLEDFATRVSDPSDPLFRHYLTTAQFKERFAPSDADVAQVRQYLEERGMHVTKVHGNNLVMEMTADAETAEQALQVHLDQYISADGRIVHAPDANPLFPSDLSQRILGVHGLNTFAAHRKHSVRLEADTAAAPKVNAQVRPRTLTGFTASELRTAYQANGFTNPGSGQSVALFELDDYTDSDITSYASSNSISPMPTLVRKRSSGASTTAGSGADEVTLDIELAMAMAPSLSNIYVYEGPNTDAGVIAAYSAIASDNLAKSVSTSWGLAETENSSNLLNSEKNIFNQMASQGQSMFAAAGDSGAYDDPYNTSALAVDDPGSQVWVTSVGGTSLSATGTGTYLSETTWASSSSGSGGGGGISALWAQPSWQNLFHNTANGGSASMRMVPDVSLNADPNTGYAIVFDGINYTYGGTSCAAPLWAGFAAIVNQGLHSSNNTTLGFANPSLYRIFQSSLGSAAFHDIADNSTNLYYHAVTGYDMATGLGTLKASALYTDLLGTLPPLPPTVTATSPSNYTMNVSWTTQSGATNYTLYRYSSANNTATQLQSGTQTSYSETLTFQPYYYYYVTVAVSSVSSGNSAPAAVSPLVPSAPTAPSALQQVN